MSARMKLTCDEGILEDNLEADNNPASADYVIATHNEARDACS